MAGPAAIVVCPLEFERRALRRAGLSGCELACCGPGANALRSWAQDRKPDGPVILCGLAGSLREGFATGRAYVVTTVIGEDGSQRVPILDGEALETQTPKATVTSAPETLTSMSAKSTLANLVLGAISRSRPI